MLEPYALQCEHLEEPLGIDVPQPRLSWRTRSPRRGDRTMQYRVVVVRVETGDQREEVWRVGPEPAGPLANVTYAGADLAPMTRYEWEVTLWGADGREAGTAVSSFETGLESPGGWSALWIGRDDSEPTKIDPPTDSSATNRTRSLPPSAMMRRSFTLGRRPVRARLYITAHGIFRCFVNGQRAGDDELAPGWQDYRQRVCYETYDVTELLSEGENVLGVVLTDGWWSGFVGFDPRRAGKLYGDAPALLAQLVIDLDDGSREMITSDGEWRECAGRIRYADLLMGEAHDARLDVPGWDRPGFDGADWAAVGVIDADTATVEGSRVQPVRIVEEIQPLEIIRLGEDATLVDFGQNLVGRLRLTVRGGDEGCRVVITHAEMLDEGDLYLDNLRSAEARDVFVCSGEPVETFEPMFTVHGFRYAKVVGYPEQLMSTDVVACVLQSDMPWTGSFESSDLLINQLYQNIRWGQSGNLVSVPTDCPQRDERLGWIADAQVFLPTACRNADVAAFFANWMEDVISGQDESGAFPDLAPPASLMKPGAPAWGDGGVIIPWILYQNYGDVRVLRRAYPAMRRWLDYIHEANPDLIWTRRTGRAYGDWLQVGVQTPREVLATAYFARSADLTARVAAVLGRHQEADELRKLFEAIRARFVDSFVSSDGRVEGDTQTCYLLALAFDLLPEELRHQALDHLVADIVNRDHHLTTGFVGVSMLCQVLSAEGRSDVAYRLLQQESFPSWLFSVKHGATTIWERWDGWTPGNGFQSPDMNSFNHYSLGAVGDWLFGSVAGLGQAAQSVGYADLHLEPQIGGRLTFAAGSQQTPRGLLASSWQVKGGAVRWSVEIPPGNPATVVVPTSDAAAVTESGRPLSEVEHVTVIECRGRRLVCEVASGTYRFEGPYAAPDGAGPSGRGRPQTADA